MDKKIKRILTATGTVRFEKACSPSGNGLFTVVVTVIYKLYEDDTIEIVKPNLNEPNQLYAPLSLEDARQILELATEPITRL